MPGDRTEQATPHRREKARKDGDVLYSRELTSAAGMLAGVGALGLVGTRFLYGFQHCLAASLDAGAAKNWEGAAVQTTLMALRQSTFDMLLPAGVIVIAMVGVACFAGVAQSGGPQLRFPAIGFRADRISPVRNLKNIFSSRAAARLGKSLLPATFLAVFAYMRITHELSVPPFSHSRIQLLSSDVFGLLITAAWLIAAWALVDYAVEWRSRESRLRMSREEVKQEFKEMEGSPQTRGRIRGLQRQMRRRKVKADVSRAAVVVTNPTHYAVALGFDFVAMETPKVLAKGRNLLAEEIKAEARWAGVPIIENPPLARSLYRSVEVGRAIPVDLYSAVATILAYLYRQRVGAEARDRLRHNPQASSEQASSDAVSDRLDGDQP